MKKRATASRHASDPLRTYRAKRRFDVTDEPRGNAVAVKARRARVKSLAYVIQKHDATRLHYDFRLEHGGALWSWAVPKGPSLDPKERRLAARTEDHPIEYAKFEGVIPEGEYGAGPVIVWDRGEWIPEGDPAAMMEKGHLVFGLRGEKLHGRFHLVRLRPRAGEKEGWLLFKGKDEHAGVGEITAEAPLSVSSGRSIEDVSAAPKRVWRSNRATGGRAGPRAASTGGRAEPRATSAGAGRRSSSARSTQRTATMEPAGESIAGALEALPLGFGLTNLDKVLYPERGLTKAQLLAYYASVAEPLLRLGGRRPLALVRAPDGWKGSQKFFQKHPSAGMPPAIRTIPIREKNGPEISLYVDDLPGLVGLGQMGCLEIHTWGCHVDRVEQPDELVLDVDPDPALPFARVIETALRLRDRLEELGLASFVKTTGGKGLHVVVPFVRGHDWDTHKAFALALVEGLAREEPALYLTNMRKDLRGKKIFLDYLRNGRGATAVAAYSPRARAGATVATPLGWSELGPSLRPAALDVDAVLERVRAGLDPWAAYPSTKQRLTRSILRAAGVR